MKSDSGRFETPSPMLSFLLRGSPKAILLRAGFMITLIALADWRIEGNIPLGFLYLFPMVLVGTLLRRWQIALVAAVCAFLTEIFDTFDWYSPTGIPRDILIFAAFFCMGLFVYEFARNRKIELGHVERIELEVRARREAEEQLAVLVESSPAAVLTANSEGKILLANEAAQRLFAVPPGSLSGRSIHDFLPSLANIPAPDERRVPFRTAMQCRGRRLSGEVFLADVWFSTYRTSAGSRLAAMVIDTSEELRNREELSLHQLLAGSRILVGAVSHEIRNVCGAIAMAHANLARGGALAENKDFEALGNLILALGKIAAMDLRQMADQASPVDLASLLEELRIVIEPSLAEQDISLSMDIDPALPAVWADRQSLLQVFLNLTKNSERAMLDRARRNLDIIARREKQGVVIRFRDTGCGVAHPDRLFRPFQQEAQATGLGLYLSRAFMRSFRGDLRHESEIDGSSFIVELTPVLSGARDDGSAKDNYGAKDPDSAGRRPQPVSGEPQPLTRS
jgi:PAS domain S-box-containing protein